MLQISICGVASMHFLAVACCHSSLEMSLFSLVSLPVATLKQRGS